MTKLTDDRLREILDLFHLHPRGTHFCVAEQRAGYEFDNEMMTSLVKELLLLRAECQAAREYKVAKADAERSQSRGDVARYFAAKEAYDAARKATDDGGYQP